jgi:hypothetical protein
MRYRHLAYIAAAAFAVCIDAFAQTAYTPKSGSTERKAIMDAVRVPAEKEFRQEVIFKVDILRVAGDWAYARVSPTLPNGAEIDFSRTKYRKQIELGAFDPQGEALLRREDGEWKVLEWAFGRTDVASAEWPDKYRLPKSLLQ